MLASPPRRSAARVLAAACLAIAVGCARDVAPDLLLVNATVHTLDDSLPLARAVAIHGDSILWVGDTVDAARYARTAHRVIDLDGGALLPGFVDAHTHVAELGQSLERLDLTGVATPAEAIARVAERAAGLPAGTWIVGFGWDEGAWADRYPDKHELTRRVPDHPVVLRGLHGFAAWANQRALDLALIQRGVAVPVGGEIRVDGRGEPTGLVLNRAVELLDKAVPPPGPAQRDSQVVRALRVMAAHGYTGVHEAGTAADVVASLQRLADADRLPVRVYVMLDGRDPDLLYNWQAHGPLTHANGSLVVRAVKAYYDGALGSRGAQLLADYSDRPGHRGVAGAAYGFDRASVGALMASGFQVGIHAIGDAGNRAALDFIDSVVAAQPPRESPRHRIEHAQVIAPADLPRFARLGVIASMQPPHAVEDMDWVEARLGAARTAGAYAWRSLLASGAHLALSSDLPGSGWGIAYGLHSAVTRRDTTGLPAEGFTPSQRLTVDEAVRGYTVWNAYAGFDETRAGVIRAGMRADLTALSVDPYAVADPKDLLGITPRLTVSRGRVTFDARPTTAP